VSKDLATAANADENSTVHHDAAQNKSKNTYTRRRVGDALTYIFLSIMGIIWLVPIFWIFMESFNAFPGPYNDGFIPKEYTLRNYVQLWTDNSQLAFGQMYMRTLIVAIFTCLISTAFVLAVSYSLSRLRFSFRTKFMNIVLVLGMFPGIMVVASLYYLLKSMGLTNSGLPIIIGLIVVYSAGSGAGFFVMKGYMDTIPMSLDEAATLDGCTKWQVFTKIILPVARPMVVYQVITSFLGSVARLRAGQGHHQDARQLHRCPRPVADDTGAGLADAVVCTLRCGRRVRFHPNRRPVHGDAAFLCRIDVRLSQGLNTYYVIRQRLRYRITMPLPDRYD
jgi:arabinogalactan oligomer/maltooligosaccharide transport system permease protein